MGNNPLPDFPQIAKDYLKYEDMTLVLVGDKKERNRFQIILKATSRKEKPLAGRLVAFLFEKTRYFLQCAHLKKLLVLDLCFYMLMCPGGVEGNMNANPA
jgi:hypothetical protein